jgi:predicted transcriptional regulator
MNQGKNKAKPHRSRYEIVKEILCTVLLRNQSPSSLYLCKLLHIEYGVRLTYNQTLSYLVPLVESGLLIKKTDYGLHQYYEITDTGRRYLQVYSIMEDNLRPVASISTPLIRT